MSESKGFFGKSKNNLYILILAAIGVFVYSYYFEKSFAFTATSYDTDMDVHAMFAQNFYLNPKEFIKYWLKVPYCFWHLIVKTLSSKLGVELMHAAAFVTAVFGVLSYAVNTLFINGILKKFKEESVNLLLFSATLGAALCFAGPINLSHLGDAYLNAFSPNPMHNPTHMAVKAFGMLTMMAGIDLIRDYKSEERYFFAGLKRLPLFFGIFLFLSTVTKPTFMYMLLPAGFIVVLWDLIASCVKKTGTAPAIGKTILYVFLASIPSIIYLLIEYLAFYSWGNSDYHSSIIITKPLTVWHFTAYNVPTSILMGMAFPLFMFFTNLRYFVKSAEGRIGAIGYAVGVLQFSILAESGVGMDAGNFSWCMMAGMTVFFAVSLSRLGTLTLKEDSGKWEKIRILIAWILFALHVSGYFTYYKVI